MSNVSFLLLFTLKIKTLLLQEVLWMVFYISKNGGKSWEAEQLKSKYGVNGDPVLIFDSTGCLYYFHLSNYPKTSQTRSHCLSNQKK